MHDRYRNRHKNVAGLYDRFVQVDGPDKKGRILLECTTAQPMSHAPHQMRVNPDLRGCSLVKVAS